MSLIHPSAVIDPSAQVAEGVQIGPFAIIGPECSIGRDSVIGPHVSLIRNVRLGERCRVEAHASLGGNPQDRKFKGETSWVEVGDDAFIGEFSTINRATGEGEVTRFGSNSMLMTYAHIGHNCTIGEYVTLANSSQVAGHVHIDDYVTVGGASVFHQNVTVGKLVMIGGMSGVKQDLPPYALADGMPCRIFGINSIGLRRQAMTAAERNALKQAYRQLFFSGQDRQEVMAQLHDSHAGVLAVEELLHFVQQRGTRGLAQATDGRKTERSCGMTTVETPSVQATVPSSDAASPEVLQAGVNSTLIQA